MIVLSTSVCAASLFCLIRVLLRGERLKAGAFLVVAILCGAWASGLHIQHMQDCMPGPLMAIGIMSFCMSCNRHETFVWNWLLSPAGQAIGGGMAIAGFIMAFLVNAW